MTHTQFLVFKISCQVHSAKMQESSARRLNISFSNGQHAEAIALLFLIKKQIGMHMLLIVRAPMTLKVIAVQIT